MRASGLALFGLLSFALAGSAPASASVPAPASAAPRVARFAIVIGNNRAEADQAQDLHYADDDAVATHRLLGEAGVQSRLLVTLDADSRRLNPQLAAAGPPRAKDLDQTFAALFAEIREAAGQGATTELLLFYSGHGDVDGGEGYLVLEDGRLTRSQLYTLLERSPATRNHVFIDACKSYFMAFEKGPGGRRGSYARAFAGAAVPARLANTGFILSTSSDHDSHEWERYQAGIFSHEVRSALRGGADADGDGQISYAELGAFLGTANRNIPNARFRPDFMVRPPGADLGRVLLAWEDTRSALRLDAGTLDHIYVETARGERLLDAHPDVRQALVVHLPSERPLFVRSNDERGEYVVTADQPGRIAALSPAAPAVSRKGALHLAFEQLFAAPFGAASVVQFERSPPPGDAPGDGAPQISARRRVLRTAAGTLAIGAIAGGLALDATALWRYQSAGGASQLAISDSNHSVRRLEVASIVCYAVGVTGALLWGGTFLWRDTAVSAAPTVGARGQGMTLSIERRF